MSVIFVPGNHDSQVLDIDKKKYPDHPLFHKISGPFTKTIAGRRFRFIHGHEIDPFMSETFQKFSRTLGFIAPAFRFTKRSGIIYRDFPSDHTLEIDDTILKLRYKISREMFEALQRYRSFQGRQISFIKYAVRDKKILAGHLRNKESGLYDVVVAGHTHKPAKLDNWYLNSGSWTDSTNDFLVINPDGFAEILTWTSNGPKLNDRIITKN
jgi:predicted phosphodiesterase